MIWILEAANVSSYGRLPVGFDWTFNEITALIGRYMSFGTTESSKHVYLRLA